MSRTITALAMLAAAGALMYADGPSPGLAWLLAAGLIIGAAMRVLCRG